MRILISAGEASGEMYGAQLIRALRGRWDSELSTGETPVAPNASASNQDSAGESLRGASLRRTGEGARPHTNVADAEFFGVGGEKMRAAGCDLVIDAKDLSVVGITEILGHLPKIWGLFHKLIAQADRRKPDLAIVIDSPAFNWRVAREMKKRGIPVVYYVCPQFWAWRQGRVRYLRRYVDKALVIFPFEQKFYRDRGVDAEFVGHPLAGLPRPAISREEYGRQHGLDPGRQWITLMPGSRRKEVRMNLPGMLEAVDSLGSGYEFLLPVAPTLASNFILGLVNSHSSKIAKGEAPALGPARIALVPESLPALAHSRAAVVASGTATVEAALMETPFVMVYRVTPLSYLLGRWMVKVPHFAMVNLIVGKEVVPELVQHDFTAENVVTQLKQIIPDGRPREKMIQGLQMVRTLLRGETTKGHAADRAAEVILQLLKAALADRTQSAEAAQSG